MAINEAQELCDASPAKKKQFNIRQQCLATIAANLIALSHGTIIGWVSPAIPKLSSAGTPLIKSGPLTNDQISWIGSINCVGGLLGSFSFGYFTAMLGSKRAVFFLAFPLAAFWLLIYYGDTYYHILIARFIGGWAGGGVRSSIMLYISEVANDDIRGRLGSATLFIRNVGTLIGYILGACVDYQIVPCISISVPITFIIIFVMIPDTPRYYLHKGQNQKAEDALKYYKGYKGNDPQEDNAIQTEFDRLKAITNEQKNEEQLRFADFFERSALKGIFIGIALTTFVELTASFTIVSYAVTTFEKFGEEIDPYISSVILAVALIFGSLSSTYLADKFGRRSLNLISLLGSSCGLSGTALYYYLSKNGYHLTSHAWIPVASLSFVIFIASAGIAPLCMVCSVEYLPPKVRTYGMAIISGSFGIATFISVKMYPKLLDSIDLNGCFTIYGIGCFIGFIFVYFVLNDTTGQSLDEVGADKKIKTEHVRINSDKTSNV